jgi:hypothetical protein
MEEHPETCHCGPYGSGQKGMAWSSRSSSARDDEGWGKTGKTMANMALSADLRTKTWQIGIFDGLDAFYEHVGMQNPHWMVVEHYFRHV